MDTLSQLTPDIYQPTEADHDEASYYFSRMEYESRPYEVQCHICGCQDRGSQMALEQAGWTLSSKGEFCSFCRSQTLTIKNQVPDILSALCLHPECPEWLKDDIWDSFNNQGLQVTWSPLFFEAQLESIPDKVDRANAPNVVPFRKAQEVAS